MESLKILIIEDEKILSEALSVKFEEEGFEVKVVGSGDLALSAALDFKPDVIVLDLLLPKKEGKEVLKEIKINQDIKSTPVVVLSNLDSDDDIKECLAIGAADYFVKTNHPINEITEKVKEITMRAR